jgi:hypothetical protein
MGNWKKPRGYVHITDQLNPNHFIFKLIQDEEFVSKHRFYPLIYKSVKERKYKKNGNGKRSHKEIKNDKIVSTAKVRPIHYATHIDAAIFAYYSNELNSLYEKKLVDLGISDCITAYRSLPDSEGRGKNSAFFAKEVFDEVRKQALTRESCVVLAFDIKSFFNNLVYARLLKCWKETLGLEWLPEDHYNVFRAVTRFSYILLSDIKKLGERNGSKGFDERRLSEIRRNFGVNAFFSSPKEFRDIINSGLLPIYKKPFGNKGIPQGLPISSTLANMYLLDFDLHVNEMLKNLSFGFYRRYSDDIIVICDPAHADAVEEKIMEAIDNLADLKLSKEKTEKFLFNRISNGKVYCYQMKNEGLVQGRLKYLGFEFDGNKILVKSANVAKFYRKIIYAVKSKSRMAKGYAEKHGGFEPMIWTQKLKRRFLSRNSVKTERKKRIKFLKLDITGEYRFTFKERKIKHQSNYLSWLRRTSNSMASPQIIGQIRRHKRVFYQAIQKHFKAKDS